MTWRGREEALPCRTIEEFKTYLHNLNFSSWRPSGSYRRILVTERVRRQRLELAI